MGPIRSRNPSWSTTALLWKSTCMALVLAGCQGPRPGEAPSVESEPPATSAPGPAATDRVRSVAEADGAVQLVLPVRTDLHPGDGLHIRDGERLVATALVTAADDQRTVARVIALTDQRRPVWPDDRFGLVPADVAPAPAPAPTAAEAHAGPEPAPPVDPVPVAAPAAAGSGHPTEAPVAGPHPQEAAGHPEPATAETMHTEAILGESTHPEPPATAVAAPAVAAADGPANPALQPEVRARLEAERAYWELAARVLRLPAGAPELVALQQRLRTEIAAQGTAP